MLKDYYQLTKPGIIYGNAITVVAGFLLASRGHVDWVLLLETLVGISLVMAAGCVFNNYLDRDIDAKMERTKDRALVRGSILPSHALLFGKILAILGLLVLCFNTNSLTVATATLGLFVYVIVYTKWFKRSSTMGTVVGSVAGAVPIVVGYLAVTNTIDAGAIILFFILALWQMPHSFAIAIYRLEDYTKAGIQVLPVKKGILTTKIQTLIYIALFMVAISMLTVFGYTGHLYFWMMTILGLVWFALGVKGFKTSNDKLWARSMFIFSIVVLVVFCVVVSLGN